jgi:hypothetical protein
MEWTENKGPTEGLSLYDPRSKTGRYYPWEEEYIKKMNIWQEWYDSKGKN